MICTHGSIGEHVGQPSRRQYIPKPDGRQRPLAVAALEDKIVQRAVIAVLNAIYEEDFLGFSYGFRPKRSQHDALDALIVGITSKKVNYVLDADIRNFFDTVDQTWLVRFLEHRIGDPHIIRLIQKWLKAGILEDGVRTVSDMGTGQGSVVSPLLANIYMHYVFDLWAERWRRREAQGDIIIVRYADDIIVGFEHEMDDRATRADTKVLSCPAPRSATLNVSDDPSTQIQRVRLAHGSPPNTVNHDLSPSGNPPCDS
jgi:group II intron reverse transcriptase/maturase